jgi:hypothetical protein
MSPTFPPALKRLTIGILPVACLVVSACGTGEPAAKAQATATRSTNQLYLTAVAPTRTPVSKVLSDPGAQAGGTVVSVGMPTCLRPERPQRAWQPADNCRTVVMKDARVELLPPSEFPAPQGIRCVDWPVFVRVISVPAQSARFRDQAAVGASRWIGSCDLASVFPVR